MARPINGIIFRLTVGEVRKFDKREKRQARIEIPWDYVEPYYPADFTVRKKNPIYVYAKHGNNDTTPEGYIPSQAYIDTTINGLEKYDAKMAHMFFETTVGMPRNMNTYSKWKKNIAKRATEYLIAAHYGRRY